MTGKIRIALLTLLTFCLVLVNSNQSLAQLKLPQLKELNIPKIELNRPDTKNEPNLNSTNPSLDIPDFTNKEDTQTTTNNAVEKKTENNKNVETNKATDQAKNDKNKNDSDSPYLDHLECKERCKFYFKRSKEIFPESKEITACAGRLFNNPKGYCQMACETNPDYLGMSEEEAKERFVPRDTLECQEDCDHHYGNCVMFYAETLSGKDLTNLSECCRMILDGLETSVCREGCEATPTFMDGL